MSADLGGEGGGRMGMRSCALVVGRKRMIPDYSLWRREKDVQYLSSSYWYKILGAWLFSGKSPMA